MTYFYLKALHIIFVVTWFAGLFYIVRLFVYFSEAQNMPNPERQILQKQYKIMQKRLWYGITWPSMILTLIFGPWILIEIPGFFEQDWMRLKLLMVAGLIAYHLYCHKIFKQQQNEVVTWNSFQLRIWNELATLFLVAVVFLVIFKDTLSWLFGLTGLLIFAAVLMLAIKIYKAKREKSN
jgi:putative membrane protein